MTRNELTRRVWILRLGGAAALTGFSGSGLDAAGGKLPPGLYEPSLEHLAHSLKTPVAPDSLRGVARHFAHEEFLLIQELTGLMLGEEPSSPPVPEIAVWIDLVVGRSENVCSAARALSPMHRHLAVNYYGEGAVRELETEEPWKICREGLADLKQAGFQRRDHSARLAHLVEREKAEDAFTVWLKRRVLDGFYTSKEGLRELDYKGNSVYAESPGCEHDYGDQ